MSNAKQFAFVPRETPRFGVVNGGRKPIATVQPQPAEGSQEVVVRNIQRTRHRGLFLVDSTAETKQASPVHGDYFEQARRIVAQVEWEIEQQVARENRQNMLGMQPCAVLPGTKSSATGGGMRNRLTRFFGF